MGRLPVLQSFQPLSLQEGERTAFFDSLSQDSLFDSLVRHEAIRQQILAVLGELDVQNGDELASIQAGVSSPLLLPQEDFSVQAGGHTGMIKPAFFNLSADHAHGHRGWLSGAIIAPRRKLDLHAAMRLSSTQEGKLRVLKPAREAGFSHKLVQQFARRSLRKSSEDMMAANMRLNGEVVGHPSFDVDLLDLDAANDWPRLDPGAELEGDYGKLVLISNGEIHIVNKETGAKVVELRLGASNIFPAFEIQAFHPDYSPDVKIVLPKGANVLEYEFDPNDPNNIAILEEIMRYHAKKSVNALVAAEQSNPSIAPSKPSEGGLFGRLSRFFGGR